VWSGQPDPAETRRGLEGRDEPETLLARLLEELEKAYPRERAFTAGEVIELVRLSPILHRDLRDILAELAAGRDGAISSVRLGKRLGALRERYDAQRRCLVDQTDPHKGIKLWKVRRAS
jgi:hypothetical protein